MHCSALIRLRLLSITFSLSTRDPLMPRVAKCVGMNMMYTTMWKLNHPSLSANTFKKFLELKNSYAFSTYGLKNGKIASAETWTHSRQVGPCNYGDEHIIAIPQKQFFSSIFQQLFAWELRVSNKPNSTQQMTKRCEHNHNLDDHHAEWR